MTKSSKLQGKIIWLTGSSSGIGLALAHELARRGARLALTARRKEVLDNLAQEIINAGGAAIVCPGDVTNQENLNSCVKQIQDELGEIDILISNAGANLYVYPEKFSANDYLDLMNINFGGSLRCLEAVIPNMINRRKGHIVAVASVAGYRGLPSAGAYGASKAAMINFLEGLRFQLSDYNIFLSIVNPGFVRTPLTDINNFKMPFIVDADYAARVICDGIENQSKEITFPKIFAWFMKISRIIPFPIYEWFTYRIWNSMKDRKMSR